MGSAKVLRGGHGGDDVLEMISKIIVYSVLIGSLVLILALIGLFFSAKAGINMLMKSNNPEMEGAYRDSHGCIPSAGFVWSDVEKRCVQLWK